MEHTFFMHCHFACVKILAEHCVMVRNVMVEIRLNPIPNPKPDPNPNPKHLRKKITKNS